jgi:hypothetical protein
MSRVLTHDPFDIREATEEEKDFLVNNCGVSYYGGNAFLRETSLNTETVCIEVVTGGMFRGELRKPEYRIMEVSIHGMCEYACSSMLTLPRGLKFGPRLTIVREEA